MAAGRSLKVAWPRVLFCFLFLVACPAAPFHSAPSNPSSTGFPRLKRQRPARKQASSPAGPGPPYRAVYSLTRVGLVRRPLASFPCLCRRSLSPAACRAAFRLR
ncbi:hypothetical protein NN561_011254 [Cricetulus griseus]